MNATSHCASLAGPVRPLPASNVVARRDRRARMLFAVLGLVVALGGCSVANQAIRSDFTDFNAIVQFNQSQQMLLNLVRLHYREAPLFMQAGSLSAAYESRASGSVGYSVEVGSSRTAGLGAEYYFSTKPTITYTPIEGKNFVDQFMSPIKIETFGLLVRSGWPVDRLAELLMERVFVGTDIVVNDRRAPTYPRFAQLVASLRAAQEEGRLRVTTEGGKQVVQAGATTIPTEAWEFRSLIDVMFSAARNTQTPPAYAGRARPPINDGVLNIRVSGDVPDDALVWVRHDGYWYSIANDDIGSKDTFALLMQLMRIQAAPASPSPVLTLPVR